jgi:T5SS/PEP-CTERM-associated repeat protein
MLRFCDHFTSLVSVVAATCPFLLTFPAHAVTTSWIANSGSFTTAANWTSGVPDSDDTAVFNRGFVAYEVNFPGGSVFNPPPNYAIDYLRVFTNEVSLVWVDSPFMTVPRLSVVNPGDSIIVGQDPGNVAILNTTLSTLSGARAWVGFFAGSEGTLNVSSGTFSMSESIDVGGSGKGTLNIAAGGRVESSSANIGRNVNSEGRATITGVNSEWTISDSLRVGDAGMGTLTIQNGGKVSDSSGSIATGTVTVSGAGSTWTNSIDLKVGNFGTGTLTIEAGGSVSNSSGTIGDFMGSGTVAVAGAGSTWNNTSNLMVGAIGAGTLMIEAGGGVSSSSGTISSNAGSAGTVTVTGAGSTWTINFGLTVGRRGSGSLTIADGGLVSNGFESVINDDSLAGSGSTVSVTGVGSRWISGNTLFVGRSGNGTLNITDGGVVSGGFAYVGRDTDTIARGWVTVEGVGSTWTNSGDIAIGGNGPFTTLGTLIVSGGGVVSAGGLLAVEPTGTVAGDGALNATVVNRGVLSPGRQPGILTDVSPGALDVNGNYLQSAAGRLQLRLGGTVPESQYDRLRVSGAVTLHGTLSVDLANSFTPSVGDGFDILDWGSLSGTFSTVILPGLADELVWNTSQLYTDGIISVVAMLPGDYNENGVVDAADYVLWRKSPNDFGGDPAGYNTWRANFGRTLSAGSGSASVDKANAAVPEPSFAICSLVASCGLILCRRGA